MRELLNRRAERWALIRKSGGPINTKLAIFVHGFRGNYLTTWGKIPELLQVHADEDDSFADWDYLFIGYSTWDVTTYLDIASLISTSWGHAMRGERPHHGKYGKLALFGHSLGTLGIRQFLCASSVHEMPLIPMLHNVMLFGTPLNGSPLAALGSLFYPVAEALKPLSPQLRMLREWSKSSFAHRPWPQVRIILGQGDWVVGYEFKDLIEWPGDAAAEITTLDHSDLVNAGTWTDCSIIDLMRANLDEH
jgi:hypothetical protein